MKRMMVLSLIALALAAPGQASDPYLDLMALPNDFPAEGFAIGNGTSFYVGSFAPTGTTGQILVGDLRTGKLSELVPPTGIQVTGMFPGYGGRPERRKPRETDLRDRTRSALRDGRR